MSKGIVDLFREVLSIFLKKKKILNSKAVGLQIYYTIEMAEYIFPSFL